MPCPVRLLAAEIPLESASPGSSFRHAGMLWFPPADEAPALRGHSFHFSACETPLAPLACTTPAPGSARTQGEAVYAQGAVRASYFHAWFASSAPATAALFSNDSCPQRLSDGRKQL